MILSGTSRIASLEILPRLNLDMAHQPSTGYFSKPSTHPQPASAIASSRYYGSTVLEYAYFLPHRTSVAVLERGILNTDATARHSAMLS